MCINKAFIICVLILVAVSNQHYYNLTLVYSGASHCKAIFR